jgi:hypothetical protein
VLSSSARGYGLLCGIKYNQTKPPQQHSALRALRCRRYAVYRCAAARKKKPRVFSNPGGVFLGVFPGWVYFRCIFRAYFLVVYFTRGISFIFCAVWGSLAPCCL